MNRKQRRALESVRRAQGPSDAQAQQARLQSAMGEVQRLTMMMQAATAGGTLASQIPVVPVEGEVSVEDDPNFFRTAACEDFEERLTLTRVKLIAAHEEVYLALADMDPADAGRIAIPSAPGLVRV